MASFVGTPRALGEAAISCAEENGRHWHEAAAFTVNEGLEGISRGRECSGLATENNEPAGMRIGDAIVGN